MSMTATLITDLRTLTNDFSALLGDEGSAIRAAKFAHVIGLQDRKIHLHGRLNTLLESLKTAPKSAEQAEEIREILTGLIGRAQGNEKAFEIGFLAIERIVNRIMSVMRRAVQKDTPRYTARGSYHHNQKQSLVLQTDRTA